MRTRVMSMRTKNINVPRPARPLGGTPPTSPALITQAVEALRVHGNKAAAARALGMHIDTFRNRIEASEVRTDWKPAGRVKAAKARLLPQPSGSEIKRYVLTAAQSGTKLHEPTWAALNDIADTLGAEIMVSSFSYSHRQEGSGKRGTGGGDLGLEWYDPALQSYFVDEMVALAPSLVWNGNLNILPTAVDPLSAMDNYNGRASSIFGHTKQHMKSIPTMPGSAAKLQYTTGVCTQISYVAKKTGQKAAFDHVFGGLLVEVNSEGSWWVRQLNVDSRGRLFDFSIVSDGTPSIGAKALIFGDVHAIHQTPESRAAMVALVKEVRPDKIVAHDIFDMQSRGHHNRRDPHKMFELHKSRRENVAMEVGYTAEVLTELSALAPVIVVSSNHDLHLSRWLKEADWRLDPVNAEFFLACQSAYLAAISSGRPFDALKWAIGHINPVKGVRFLAPGESFVICRDASGGIELGLHGDLGPGGSRGSIRNLSRLGRKVVIGHSHSAGIFNGAWQVGLSAPEDAFSYAKGAPSSWSNSACLVHPNGRRQMLTCWGGKWRA